MLTRINLKSISKQGQSVFGEIYFKDDDILFPEENWNDFIVVILNWWLEELTKFTKNEKTTAELLFMDGPLSVKINHFDDKTLKFFFTHNDKIIKSLLVETENFIKFFLIEVNTLILFLEKNKWDNDEIRKLVKNYALLSQEYSPASGNL